MADVSSMYKLDLQRDTFALLKASNAHELNVRERQIEQWIASKPELLFNDQEAVMIIAQEMTGEPQADLLAVDSQGNLIIIEIKRHWSDRNTIGQLLDYAARLSDWDYDAFNKRWKADKGRDQDDLFEAFKRFAENSYFDQRDFLKTKRLYVLAGEADDALKRIISWLRKDYEVPIDFIPFEFFCHEAELFLRIHKIDVEPIPCNGHFAGDWFFNTNETYAAGAWKAMIEQHAIACCGYGQASTKAKMDMPSVGDRVLVYLNGKGIIAAGNILEDESTENDTIFGNEHLKGDEFHRKVAWIARVPPEKAVAVSEISSMGYNPPVRCTICRWNDAKVAEQVTKRLMERTLQ